MAFPLYFEVMNQIGTAAFAIAGYLVGARKRLDLLGVVIVALLTGIGGGVMRDLLLSRTPRVFLDALPIYTIFATLAVAWVIKLHQRHKGLLRKLFIVADSIGLVAFSLAGAKIGMDFGVNLFGVCFLGFVTAVGGGLVRDMMVNDVPFILHEDFYGTVAILLSVALYLLKGWGLEGAAVEWSLFAIGLTLRLVAHKQDFRLPRVDG
ncbi:MULTISPECIES: trimeric intracellular cation channel family protein [Silvimonas]|uniref:trimeric intracellular cation channel family protein n=1 Tax=Silvimonas TaxID=300264 RepID=UPI0024B3A60C|nr:MULTISPECIES: trimeric intracellular cation channel family protein [Silvimonas]MDR3426289.1 trimeric intracellular cation channel family protein [Silvimonas sp.]